MVKPEPWENPMLDTMWSFMQMGGLKANYPALKEACMELRQMLMQKTAGQRKDRPKDKRENPRTTNRSFEPVPLGHEPFPKIERVEE